MNLNPNEFTDREIEIHCRGFGLGILEIISYLEFREINTNCEVEHSAFNDVINTLKEQYKDEIEFCGEV